MNTSEWLETFYALIVCLAVMFGSAAVMALAVTWWGARKRKSRW